MNPNWPRLQALWAPTGHIGYGASALSYDGLPWIDITNRLIGPWDINRGRQYELDQVTAGTWSGTLDNRDGLFDPNNSSGPLFGIVAPYQPFRVRAQWPVTANLLTLGQAAAVTTAQYAVGANVNPQASGWSSSGGAVSYFTATVSATAYSGNFVLEAGITAGSGVRLFLAQPVVPGTVYSFQVQARATSGAAQVTPFIAAFAPGGGSVSAATGPAVTLGSSWSQLSVSMTVPASAGYAWIGVTLPNPNPACTVQLCAAQLEAAAAPSAFAPPGSWFNLFTGGIERFPQTWRHFGTLGLVQATAVDALALLSQSKLTDPFNAAVFHPAAGPPPSFAYLLGDQPGQNFADATGNRPPATVAVSSGGPGTVTAGTAQAAASPGGGFVLPAGATVVDLTGPATFGSNLPGDVMSFIQIPANSTGGIGPGVYGQGWTRMIAFRVLGKPVYDSAIWMASASYSNTLYAAGFLIDSGLGINAALLDGSHTSLIGFNTVDVGNWHLAFLGISADGSQYCVGLDADYNILSASPSYSSLLAGGYAADYIGAAAWGTNTTATQFNLYGDVAFAVEWPGLLTGNQAAAIYNAWRTGWANDSTGNRARHILGSANWTGPALLDPGQTTAMAPATDIAGTDAASALQAVTDTEGGVLFADASGNVVFQARSARWSPPPASVVFGENAAAGEWPFEDQPVFDFDPTLVTNLAEVTHSATGQTFTAQDFTSQVANGIRDRQVTSQAASVQEAQDKANFLVSRYKTPRTRVASLALHPAANPAMWPVVLGLDIGSRAKAVRRPAAASPVVVDGFVENLAWNVDTTGEARLTVQMSPADTTAYGRFDYSNFDQFVFAY